MKNPHAVSLLSAVSAALVASTALAAGEHAGGHAHEAHAIGKPGVAANAKRTVQIAMTDTMRFTPASVSVMRGETVRFVVKNAGQIKHEMVLGTEKELKDHNEVMKKNPEMEHADENMVTVAPGRSGEIVWQFTQAGKVDFACLQPGHYDAGMKGQVLVARADASKSLGMTDGEIRKVDQGTKKITIKHAEIKSLDMPGMTMVFQVRDPALLDKVKAGDKVKFTAEKVGGAIVVTDIQVVP